MHSTATNVAAVKADRERMAAIAALPEAKGREGLAMTLAATGLSVDEARASLAAAPIDPAVASAMWDNVLTARGMKIAARDASASLWDQVLQQRGFAVGAGA